MNCFILLAFSAVGKVSLDCRIVDLNIYRVDLDRLGLIFDVWM